MSKDKINLNGLSVNDLVEYCREHGINPDLKIEISDHEGNDIRPAQAVCNDINDNDEEVLWLRG